MKKVTVITLLIMSSLFAKAQYTNDSEGIPDKDLFGNYIIIRITPLYATKNEAINQVNAFKLWCEENTFLKPYLNYIGYWQVRSVDKEKTGKWIAGYCNYHRQIKELYEMDKRFLQIYCENADIWQFKDMLKNSACPPEEKK